MIESFKPSRFLGYSFMVDSETYLRTQQVADALSVGVSTVKRWVDAGSIEATVTKGKHRLILLSSALQFARRRRFPVERLLTLTGCPPSAPISASTCDLLVEALKGGRGGEASTLIASAWRSDRGAVGLADDLIRPVMERVGHGWMVGSWDVYEEHQASQIVSSVLTDLIGRATGSAPGPGRPLALGAAAEGDLYSLPGLLGELVLREVGWDVRNLGTNLPLRSLAAATRDYRPSLIFLSASHLADRERFVQEYAYFYESAARVGSAIILGGRALDPDLRSRLVFASFGDRMAHLAEFGRRLLPAASAPAAARPNPAGPMDTSN